MNRLYFTLRNALIFILVTVFFQNAIVFGSQTFLDKFLMSIIFGFLLTFSTNVLRFLKLPVNVSSLFLINLVTVFITFIILHSPFNFIRIQAQSVSTGIAFLDPIVFTDSTMAILILSLTTAVFLSIFDFIHQKS